MEIKSLYEWKKPVFTNCVLDAVYEVFPAPFRCPQGVVEMLRLGWNMEHTILEDAPGTKCRDNRGIL